LLALAVLLCMPAASAGASRQTPAGALKQYASAGHVLGFDAGAYYVSNGTYALSVSFDGAAPVVPISDGAASVSAPAPQAAALGRVSYRGLWKGISLSYDAPGGGIARSTWTLAPGADPAAIRLRYNRAVALSESGDLEIAFAAGSIRESRPVAWQHVDGRRQGVEVAFVQLADDVVGFRVGRYRRDLPLTIDPTLTWNTFLGGSGGDLGEAIAIDAGGDVYVAGYSFASWGSPVNPYASGGDAFVARLTSTGTMVWNTFIGGSGEERAYGVAVDGAGDVYVTGHSSATWGSPVNSFAGGSEAFVVQLDSAGVENWNTFLGGGDVDFGSAIAVAGGSVYVAGYSATSWGMPVGTHTANGDAFVARLTTAGALTWNTFLGGSDDDAAEGIAVDGSGAVYVAGYSGAPWGSPVRAYTAMNDAFAARLTAAGELSWSTFLGGSGDDSGNAIAVDGSGHVYVTGSSFATWGSPVRPYTDNTDAFAAQLTAAGALNWNTFVGGAAGEFAEAIALGGGGIYVAGHSSESWGSPVAPYTAGIDGFAAFVTSAGELAWNTFLGGSGNDFGLGIAFDGDNVFVAGYGTAAWGSPVRFYTAGHDAFAARITVTPNCPAGPAAGCALPGVGGKSQLQLRSDPADPTGARDKLKWKFKGGPALAQSDFGDPATATGYALCVYDDGVLELEVGIGPNATHWRAAGSKGHLYKDPAATAGGVTNVKLFGGAAGEAKLQVKGKGANLPPVAAASPTRFFDNTTSVIVQLHQDDGACYETELTPADEVKNDGTQFKAKR
jgi:hypothetical protein